MHNGAVKQLLFPLWTATLLCASLWAQAPDATTLTGHPGEVIRVDGEVSVLGKTWKGLIGIDLATKPGTYRMSSGSLLHVMPKQFPVRRLTVAPSFVTPPPEALPQIEADLKKTSALWGRVTPRKWVAPFVLPVKDPPTS